jgi:TRPM family ion channel
MLDPEMARRVHDESFEITFPSGRIARAARVEHEDDLVSAVRVLGLVQLEASLVLVGGADGMDERELDTLRPLFAVIAASAVHSGAAVIDGGTDTGVMQLMGRARAETGAEFPLVGVLVTDLAAVPGEDAAAEAATLEPHHTHFLLVPGTSWGDEGPWLARLADMVAVGSGAVTVVVNGGEQTWRDVENSIVANRPVFVIDGSGRTADSLAAALRGDGTDPRATRLGASGLLRVADLTNLASVRRLLGEYLQGSG